ncbi:unnamed protein product [Nezara viridula]|uniref:Uncharacterized protein n=1 Tax=Nezara viridula TaxID=85310 RepID=A0A9P0MJQ0_NEZVI|nr:unnamed protein product [Nezara viridula]
MFAERVKPQMPYLEVQTPVPSSSSLATSPSDLLRVCPAAQWSSLGYTISGYVVRLRPGDTDHKDINRGQDKSEKAITSVYQQASRCLHLLCLQQKRLYCSIGTFIREQMDFIQSTVNSSL